MDNPMANNTNTYVIAIDNTSKAATFVSTDYPMTGMILFNGSTNPVFVTLGSGDVAPTAVFPTSASAPLKGKVIAPGATITFSKTAQDKFLSAIQASAGTGDLYISLGTGE